MTLFPSDKVERLAVHDKPYQCKTNFIQVSLCQVFTTLRAQYFDGLYTTLILLEEGDERRGSRKKQPWIGQKFRQQSLI